MRARGEPPAAAGRPAGRGQGGGADRGAEATRSARCRCATWSPTRRRRSSSASSTRAASCTPGSTTPEFSCAPVTWTKLWGVTRNPWNTAFSPGGSSGGSAAALAAGLGDAGHRLGHRRLDPDPVLVLRRDRVQAAVRPGAGGRDLQPRPLLPRGAAGADRGGLRAAGERHRRAAPQRRGLAAARSWRSRRSSNRSTGMRIALSVDLGCYAVDADVAASTRAAADRLRDAGATVREVAPALAAGEHQPGGPDPLRHDLRAVDPGASTSSTRTELTTYARRFVSRGRRDHQGRLGGRPGPRGRGSTPRSGRCWRSSTR